MTLNVLILGSSGFLGSEIKTLIYEKYGSAIAMYCTTKDFNSILQCNKNGGSNLPVPLSTFLKSLKNTLYVINCMSARGGLSSLEKRLANYEVPSIILEKLTSQSTVPIIWVQPESFWQYSGDNVPDQDYVYWKNQFSRLLKSSKDTTNVLPIILVLFHLIGKNDNPKRFLPKLFTRLRNEQLVDLVNPDNTFYLTDVADVAKFLISNLQKESFFKDGKTYAYPFHKIQLCKLVDTYLSLFNKETKVTYRYIQSIESPTHSRDFSEIPRVLPRPRTPLLETLKIISDNLHS